VAAVRSQGRGRGPSGLDVDPPVPRRRHQAALNLYSTTADAFDEQARTLAGLFGIQAALLLHGTDVASHLQYALAGRDAIGQAKGILMERFEIGEEAAFPMLVRSSQETDLKLTAIATWLTENPDAG